jgi:5-methylcytosine-specific restriction enzyme subunit McrC
LAGPTELVPDILVRHYRKATCVLDVKWKAPRQLPDSADLHQILAYATITGTRRVGLIYPGRRFARRIFRIAKAGISVSLFRVRITGPIDECSQSLERLAQAVQHDSD